MLGALAHPGADICLAATQTIVQFPYIADRPFFHSGSWRFNGLSAQGFLVPARTFKHSRAGGFTAALRVLVEVDSSGQPPANAAVVSFSSADAQVSWSLESQVDGTWKAYVCLNGTCTTTQTLNSMAFSQFESVAVRYRSDTERVEIFVNGKSETLNAPDDLHEMVRCQRLPVTHGV